MPGCPGAGAVTAAPPNQWRGISPCGSFSQLIRGAPLDGRGHDPAVADRLVAGFG